METIMVQVVWRIVWRRKDVRERREKENGKEEQEEREGGAA